MDDSIIRRLQASRDEHWKSEHAAGMVAGRRWAENHAQWIELERLSRMTEVGYGPFPEPLDGEGFLLLMDRQYFERDVRAQEEFWEIYCDDSPPSLAFVDGFRDSALHVFEQVRPKV